MNALRHIKDMVRWAKSAGKAGIFLLVLAAAAWSICGCQALSGADGKDGKLGLDGDTGLTGPQGQSVADSLTQNGPCAGCIERESIADDAVDDRVLADGSVTQNKIDVYAIKSNHIALGAITSDKIADGAVGSLQIADGSVEGRHLAPDSITAGDIAPGSVLAANIADDAVQPGNLADNVIKAGMIAANAVGSTLDIANAAISGADIADGQIDASHIATGAVNRLWRIKPSYSAYTYSGNWADVQGMTWDMSQGKSDAVYLVLFDASFFAYGGDNINVDFEVRLVEVDGANNVISTKTSRRLVSASESLMNPHPQYSTASHSYCCGYTCFIVCWCSSTCYYSVSCNQTHHHDFYDAQYLGVTNLMWAGTITPTAGHYLKVQFNSHSGQYMYHYQPWSGDRIMTVIEFSKAGHSP